MLTVECCHTAFVLAGHLPTGRPRWQLLRARLNPGHLGLAEHHEHLQVIVSGEVSVKIFKESEKDEESMQYALPPH